MLLYVESKGVFANFPLFNIPAEDPLSSDESDDGDYDGSVYEDNSDFELQSLRETVESQKEIMEKMITKMENTDAILMLLMQKLEIKPNSTSDKKSKSRQKSESKHPTPTTPQKEEAAHQQVVDMYSESTNPVNGTPITVNTNHAHSVAGRTYSTPDFSKYPAGEAGTMVIGKTMQRIYIGPKGGAFYLTPVKDGSGFRQRYLDTDQKAIFEAAIGNSA